MPTLSVLRSLLIAVAVSGVIAGNAGAQAEAPSARAGDRVRVDLAVGPGPGSRSTVGVLQSADSLQAILVTDRGETQRVHLATVQRALRFHGGGVCSGASGRVACALFGAVTGMAAGYTTCRALESCYIRDDTGNGMKIMVGVGGILGSAASLFFGRGGWEDVRIVPVSGR